MKTVVITKNVDFKGFADAPLRATFCYFPDAPTLSDQKIKPKRRMIMKKLNVLIALTSSQTKVMTFKEAHEQLLGVHKSQQAEEILTEICTSISQDARILDKMFPNKKVTSHKIAKIMALIPGIIIAASSTVSASAGSDQIRKGFMQIFDIASAIAEPILWFYAVTACVLIATGRNKEMGWTKLKQVGYGYICLTMIPAIFSFLRWMSMSLSASFSSFH